jgi:hypothetical protein
MDRRRFVVSVFAVTAGGCATLGPFARIVQPPRFRQAENQPAEIRLVGPSLRMPAGGAGVRVWLEVTNPNAFGFTLSTVNATLSLQDTRAATGDFPLGLPLQAGRSSVVPLDLTVSFADVPGLASVARQIATAGLHRLCARWHSRHRRREARHTDVRTHAADTRSASRHPLKLGRDVAIKVLPVAFVTDPERLGRF